MKQLTNNNYKIKTISEKVSYKQANMDHNCEVFNTCSATSTATLKKSQQLLSTLILFCVW